MDGKEMGTFDFGWFDGASVINPTMAGFVEVEVLYANSDMYDSKLSNNTITIGEDTYT